MEMSAESISQVQNKLREAMAPFYLDSDREYLNFMIERDNEINCVLCLLPIQDHSSAVAWLEKHSINFIRSVYNALGLGAGWKDIQQFGPDVAELIRYSKQLEQQKYMCLIHLRLVYERRVDVASKLALSITLIVVAVLAINN